MPQGIPFLSTRTTTQSDPIPFDVDSYANSAYKDVSVDEVPTKIGDFGSALEHISRPFFATGYNSVATLNRGVAAFYSHLDSIADYIEASSGLEAGNLFEDLATMAAEDSERWAKAAEEVGISFLDTMISEAVGGFVPGVTQFALDVGSGYTFPYMAGAQEASEKGENPFAGGMVAAAKTATLDKLFQMMHPLKTYLKAPAFGTVFGLEEAAFAPEGQKAKAYAKGFGIGAMYAATSPGGRLGLNEVKEATKLALDNLQRTPAGEFAKKKLAEERGAIEIEPKKRQRKFLKTIEEAREIDPTATERVKEIEPQDYFIEPNAEALAKAQARMDAAVGESINIIAAAIKLKDGRVFTGESHHVAMEKMDVAGVPIRDFEKVVEDANGFVTDKGIFLSRNEAVRMTGEKSEDAADIIGRKVDATAEGVDSITDYLKSDVPPGSEKGAAFHLMIKDAQKRGDYDLEIELIELADVQLREAGRFIQSASLWTKMGSPGGFIKWANKQLKSVENKYNFTDTIIKNKPEDFRLNKEEQQIVFDAFREINKMENEVDRADATLELVDMVAAKVPPSVSELIDAYRYQNMLSSPKTQMRNIGENTGNTFLTRPIDIATKGAIDYVAAAKSGKDRQAYISDVATYYKAAWNAVPNAARGFAEVMKLSSGTEVGKPDIGIQALTEFQRARAKQIPAGLTLVGRFMEASDKFNSAIIGAGEMAILMKRGVPEAEAYARGREIAEQYLYRDKLEGGRDISSPSKALDSLGQMIQYSRTLPKIGTLSKWYIPFLRTPINKAIRMVEHSPMGFIRDPKKMTLESTAQALIGSIAMAIGATATYNGETTWAAPTGRDEKELFYASGRRPFSIKIGDKWVPFWYLGPFAMAVALPAAIKYFTEDESKAITKDGYDKLGDIVTGMAQFVGSQSSTQSMGTLFSALHGDIDRTFSSQTGFTLQQMIPAGSLVRFVNTVVDPVYRKPKGFIEGIEANLPILSKNLDAHMGPDGTVATRDPINYFLPYDTGTVDKIFERDYYSKQYDIRQGLIETRNRQIQNEYDAGKITFQEYIKQSIDVLKKPQKNIQKNIKDIKKSNK